MDLTTFRRDGYAVITNLLTSAEVAAVRTNLSRLVAEADELGRHPSGCHLDFEAGTAGPAEDRELRVRKFRDHGLTDSYFWDLVRHPRVLAEVEAVIGGSPQLLQTMSLVKPPQIGTPKDWHQDLPYFPITPAQNVVGVWIAIDDATLANGCMQVVPGSHHLGPVAHVQGPTGWRLEPVLCAYLAASVRPLPMTAGSALFFDGALFHFTDANTTHQRRRSVQNHYVPATTQIADGKTGRLFALSSPIPPLAAIVPQ